MNLPDPLSSALPGFLAEAAGDVVWLYQPPLTTPVTVAGAFAELFGRTLPPDARVSHRWKAWIYPDDQATVTQAYESGIATGVYNQVFRLLLPDGSVRWLHDRAVTLGALGVIRITSDFSHHWRQELALASARTRNELLLDPGNEMTLVLDRLATIRDASRSYLSLVGLPATEVLGRPLLDGLDPAQQEEALKLFARLVADPNGRAEVEWRIAARDGGWFWIHGTLRNLLNDPYVNGVLASFRDVSARKDADQRTRERLEAVEAELLVRNRELESTSNKLRDLERLQRKVLLAMPDVLMRCTRDSTILDITGPTQQMVAPPAELIGTRFAARAELSEELRGEWLHCLERALESGRTQICAYELSVLAGQREFEARFTPIGADEVGVVIRDVAERNRLRDRVQHVAMHDELTGLLNRNALRERLEDQFTRFPDTPIALLVIDLDRFKQVNDTFGHAIGDTLLKVVANRLTRRAGTESLRARIGGDEFALAIGCGTASDVHSHVEAFVQALITELGNRMRLHGDSLYLTPSVGIAIYPTDARDPETLIRNADVAMMRAKQTGRNSYQFYDPEISAQASSMFNTEQSLRRALDEAQMTCLYQPKINVQDGTIAGVEALVRWNTPDGQTLIPERFIPLAERTGLIKPLGRWILRESIQQMAQLPRFGRPVIDLSVNVSVAQLRDNQFMLEVRDALAEFAFPAQRLTLEIAETAFVDDMQITSEALADMAHLGVQLSIDDFGTGFGGLSWLKNLPVQEIKIDRSFIKGCAIDAYDATIVSGLVEIAHNLGIRVVAEGVERADQIAFLTQVKCDVIQGFFIGMPMNSAELVRTARLWQGPRTQ
jgi:diguanylate cyclase (GGDEF)-like protein/PAS domain S-box-containing protein